MRTLRRHNGIRLQMGRGCWVHGESEHRGFRIVGAKPCQNAASRLGQCEQGGHEVMERLKGVVD
jgi:hypothetical protein